VLAEALQKRREEKEARKKLRMEARMVKSNISDLFLCVFIIVSFFLRDLISPHLTSLFPLTRSFLFSPHSFRPRQLWPKRKQRPR
jgi:hypothetical protein